MNNPDSFKSRVGKFYISRQLIEDNPTLVKEILSTTIVVRAEMLYESDVVSYVGLSHLFDPTPLGATAPYYKPIIEDNYFLCWAKNE